MIISSSHKENLKIQIEVLNFLELLLLLLLLLLLFSLLGFTERNGNWVRECLLCLLLFFLFYY